MPKLLSILVDVQDIYVDKIYPNFYKFFYPDKPIGAAPRGHFFVGGGGGVWAKKFVTLRGLRISEKKKSSTSRQYCKCINRQ